jgi:hypothetical protein
MLQVNACLEFYAFLIEEDDILTDAGRERVVEALKAAPTAPASGAPAVEMAEEEAQLRGADSAAPSGGGRSTASGGEGGRAVRHVGAKTFVLEDGVWIDTAFDPDTMTTERVEFGSETYFELLAARPGWGDYLALGERVIFVSDEAGEPTAYEIGEAGEGGEGWAVAPATKVPATETPAPATPTDQAVEPGDTEPTEPTEPTSTPGGDQPLTPSSGLCPGAMAMSAVGLAALVVWESWRR